MKLHSSLNEEKVKIIALVYLQMNENLVGWMRVENTRNEFTSSSMAQVNPGQLDSQYMKLNRFVA